MFLMHKYLTNNLNLISFSNNDSIFKMRILKLLTEYLNRRFGRELTLKDFRSQQIQKKMKLQNILNKLGINQPIKIKKDSRERHIDN